MMGRHHIPYNVIAIENLEKINHSN